MVYIIQGEITRHVAILVFYKSDKLELLRASLSEDTEILFTLDGNLELKATLDARFYNSRIRGNWFELSSEIKEFLQHPEKLSSYKKVATPAARFSKQISNDAPKLTEDIKKQLTKNSLEDIFKSMH